LNNTSLKILKGWKILRMRKIRKVKRGERVNKVKISALKARLRAASLKDINAHSPGVKTYGKKEWELLMSEKDFLWDR